MGQNPQRPHLSPVPVRGHLERLELLAIVSPDLAPHHQPLPPVGSASQDLLPQKWSYKMDLRGRKRMSNEDHSSYHQWKRQYLHRSLDQGNWTSGERDKTSSLTDSMLCYIFMFLQPEDLVNASGVCQRWHTLARNPLLWSWRTIKHEKGKDQELIRVLNSAPRIRMLHIGQFQSVAAIEGLLLSTCKFSRLRISGCDEALWRGTLLLKHRDQLRFLDVDYMAETMMQPLYTCRFLRDVYCSSWYMDETLHPYRRHCLLSTLHLHNVPGPGIHLSTVVLRQTGDIKVSVVIMDGCARSLTGGIWSLPDLSELKDHPLQKKVVLQAYGPAPEGKVVLFVIPEGLRYLVLKYHELWALCLVAGGQALPSTLKGIMMDTPHHCKHACPIYIPDIKVHCTGCSGPLKGPELTTPFGQIRMGNGNTQNGEMYYGCVYNGGMPHIHT